ncbi:phosphoglycerate dehydrogenase [Desulfovibrio sp. OttesenSCG-928-F20]|nr:phosphoglycerate dehydrogenase [Desulfovibrio sp. OttesenSCG-928-M16]MDL2290655.1 phosphoglycerate dehydrogenase [Desulfovibrio sp. OttesenSCG-928-F20]
MKIALTTSSFGKFSQEPIDLLEAANFKIVRNPHRRTLSEGEAIGLLQGCSGVVAGTEPLTARLMDALPDLRVISRCGVGIDNVDMEAAERRGILVRSTPDGPTRAVAELTVAFALNLMRHVSRMDREMRAGQWKKRMGNLLHGKNVGIVGFGRIGRAVAELFAAFGCPVAFFDPAVNDDQGIFRCMDKESLLAWADIVTLHSSKPADGSYVLDAVHVARMKEGAWLINAARGGNVDESALALALHEGVLAGAALDVYEREPYPYSGPLTRLPQVILTPHIGSYAKEARILMEVDSVRNLIEGLRQVFGEI